MKNIIVHDRSTTSLIAKRLGEHLKSKHNLPLKHQQLTEVLAVAFGHESANHMAAAAKLQEKGSKQDAVDSLVADSPTRVMILSSGGVINEIASDKNILLTRIDWDDIPEIANSEEMEKLFQAENVIGNPDLFEQTLSTQKAEAYDKAGIDEDSYIDSDTPEILSRLEILRAINEFDLLSFESRSTDTGEFWSLFHRISKSVRTHLESKHSYFEKETIKDMDELKKRSKCQGYTDTGLIWDIIDRIRVIYRRSLNLGLPNLREATKELSDNINGIFPSEGIKGEPLMQEVVGRLSSIQKEINRITYLPAFGFQDLRPCVEHLFDIYKYLDEMDVENDGQSDDIRQEMALVAYTAAKEILDINDIPSKFNDLDNPEHLFQVEIRKTWKENNRGDKGWICRVTALNDNEALKHALEAMRTNKESKDYFNECNASREVISPRIFTLDPHVLALRSLFNDKSFIEADYGEKMAMIEEKVEEIYQHSSIQKA